jgi:hypothetical protein
MFVYPKRHNSSTESHYLPHINEMNMKGIQFHVKVSQIGKHEKQNRISVNEFDMRIVIFFQCKSKCHK